MTDKQIIKTLENIQEYCKDPTICENCTFYHDKDNSCQLMEIGKLIARYPINWDMKKLEELINE